MSALLQRYQQAMPWRPQKGPQIEAYLSEADETLYGGAAGGGKTSLAVGLAATRHLKTLIMRREATQLGGILDEIAEKFDEERAGYSGKTNEWKLPAWDGVKRKIMLGSCPHPGNETKWQGRERDLLVLDEAANFLESQARFLMGWVRSTVKDQRCRVLLCSNPPTSSEGLWVTQMFAPWLDPNYANPAKPGELRWFTTIGGVDHWLDGPEPFERNGETVYPKSRTFISAKIQDNKYLGIDYIATLQAMPEPLRSQMLYGDFTAGQEDNEYQVIPTEWVKAAMARWEKRPLENVSSVGVDPSLGGKDKSVMAARSGYYFYPLRRWDGAQIKTGGDMAALVVKYFGNQLCPVHVDALGIGATAIDHLEPIIGSRLVRVIASGKASGKDFSGTLGFANMRAFMWWRMRDLLNPENGQNVALPRDQKLLADLTAPRYSLKSTGIQIESKDDIKKRLQRSTDDGDAVVMCALKSPIVQYRGDYRPTVAVKGSIR